MINDLEAMGEKQLETFVSDQLVVSKVPISQKITLNKIEIWNNTDTGQLKFKVEFSLSNSAVKKINSPCKHKKTMMNCLNMKLTISLSKDGKNGTKLHHGLKAEVTKWFNSLTSLMLPYDQEGESDILVEMSPTIRV